MVCTLILYLQKVFQLERYLGHGPDVPPWSVTVILAAGDISMEGSETVEQVKKV